MTYELIDIFEAEEGSWERRVSANSDNIILQECRKLLGATLALCLLAGCNNRDEIARDIAQVEFFGPPIDFDIGDLIRVEGLLTSDGDGNFALIFRSGAGDLSGWDCVVLRDISWIRELFLPSPPSDDLQARSFEATGAVVAVNVTFGRGDGGRDGSRRCVMAIDVESIERLEMSDELAERLLLRPGTSVLKD